VMRTAGTRAAKAICVRVTEQPAASQTENAEERLGEGQVDKADEHCERRDRYKDDHRVRDQLRPGRPVHLAQFKGDLTQEAPPPPWLKAGYPL
jgi:hypothetical protein